MGLLLGLTGLRLGPADALHAGAARTSDAVFHPVLPAFLAFAGIAGMFLIS